MSWNGSGTFNRLYSWVADAAAAIDINATRMDADTDNIASVGFGNCLTRDGQGQPTADLPMAGFKHLNVANGLNPTDYAAYGQLTALQEQIGSWIVAAGTSDAITATYAPALSALVDGQLCYFRATAANATTTPTFNPNALGAETITRFGGAALLDGDIPGEYAECILRYNLANTRWELLNPRNPPAYTSPNIQSFITGAGTYTTPTGALYIEIEMVGGGGGGGGSGAGALNGTNGNTTAFNSVNAAGGGGGSASTTTSGQGGGGAGGGGSGSAQIRFNGQAGGNGGNVTNTNPTVGGAGGSTVFGGGGAGGTSSINPGAGQTNTGGGGGGAGSGSVSLGGGGGGGGGQYARLVIGSPASTYSYSVGAAASGGTGTAGGEPGAAGVIIVTAYFQ